MAIMKLNGLAKKAVIAMMTGYPFNHEYWVARDFVKIVGCSENKTGDLRNKIAPICERELLQTYDNRNRPVTKIGVRLSQKSEDIPEVIAVIMENNLLHHYKPGNSYYDSTKDKFLDWVFSEDKPTLKPSKKSIASATEDEIYEVVGRVCDRLGWKLNRSKGSITKKSDNSKEETLRNQLLKAFYVDDRTELNLQAKIAYTKNILKAIFIMNNETEV